MNLHQIHPESKSGDQIQAMFDDIAPRYDLLNRLLSAGQDRRWRRIAVQDALADRADLRGLRVLDVCTGTGDLACEFSRHPSVTAVTGIDFVSAMVRQARNKASVGPQWLVGDAARLPFQDGRFDVVSVAFGLRNLVDPAGGIREMARLLRPGGRLVVLEFFPPPRGLQSALFRWYFRNILPRVGRWLSGSHQYDAYRYLPESVECFAEPQEVAEWMLGAGLASHRIRRLAFGSVGLLVGEKAGAVRRLEESGSQSAVLTNSETAGLVRIA